MRHEAAAYDVYAELFRELRRAVDEQDPEAVRRIELAYGELPSDRRSIAAAAVHDVAMSYPMRARIHFERWWERARAAS